MSEATALPTEPQPLPKTCKCLWHHLEGAKFYLVVRTIASQGIVNAREIPKTRKKTSFFNENFFCLFSIFCRSGKSLFSAQLTSRRLILSVHVPGRNK